jgi:hypothetical protein
MSRRRSWTRSPAPPIRPAVSRPTLRSNGTFVAEENVVCTHAPCELPRIEGQYKFTRAGEKRYIHLTADDGADVRWAWQKFGDELQLRKAGSSAWAVLGHIAIE